MEFLTPKARRKVRALGVKQDLMCLAAQGYVIDGMRQLTREEYRAALIKRVEQRITRHMGGKFNAGTNAERAADIAKHGPASRWYFARNSRSHAGDDTRGIQWWLKRWYREGRFNDRR